MNAALFPRSYAQTMGLGVTAWTQKESTTYQGFWSLDLSPPLGPEDLNIIVPCVTRSSYERNDFLQLSLRAHKRGYCVTVYVRFWK